MDWDSLIMANERSVTMTLTFDTVCRGPATEGRGKGEGASRTINYVLEK